MPNVRLHFDRDSLIGAGAEIIPASPTSSREYLVLAGVRMWVSSEDNSVAFFEQDMELLTGELPTGININLVTKITSHVHMGMADRACGIYSYRTARATLSFFGDKINRFKIVYEAKNFQDMQMLHERICGGTIVPTVDFTAAQMPLLRPNTDQMRRLEERAAAMAMSLLQQAMTRLEDTINS